MMKKAICFLLLALLVTPLIGVAHAAREVPLDRTDMRIQVPDDFIVITADTVAQMGDALSDFGATVTETEVKLSRDHDLFLAISRAMQCTLFLSEEETVVSRSVGDLIGYDDRDTVRALLLGDPPPDSAGVRELEREGALFYRVDCGVTDGVGRILYTTIMNGKCYTLCVVDNTGELNDNINSLIDTVFDSWDYTIEAEAQRIQAFRDQATTTAFWIGLPVGLLLAGWLVWSMIRQIRARRMEEDRRKIVPKKPRR